MPPPITSGHRGWVCGSADSPFFDQREHAERFVPDLRVTKNFPVFSQISLEELDDVSHGNNGPCLGLFVFCDISECDHPE
jgi:hypothetical protein